MGDNRVKTLRIVHVFEKDVWRSPADLASALTCAAGRAHAASELRDVSEADMSAFTADDYLSLSAAMPNGSCEYIGEIERLGKSTFAHIRQYLDLQLMFRTECFGYGASVIVGAWSCHAPAYSGKYGVIATAVKPHKFKTPMVLHLFRYTT